MSTFSGFLDEIENVSVDRFETFNFRSRAFFLSHCHTDHMVGLNEINSLNQSLPGPLYLSEISQVIIKRQYPNIKNLIALKIGETTPILFGISKNDELNNCETKKTSVTAIPAGHCPGSVMFLFEQNNKKILYTGDFRLYRNDIETMIALKKFNGKIILDCLYLDSTFLSLDYKYFPRQRDSVNKIIEITEKWLDKDSNNIVLLRPPANYGYEFLLVELSKYFNFKIHVSKSTYTDYLYIPEFDSHISSNPYQSGRIHLCAPESNNDKIEWKSKTSSCLSKLDERFICIIRPTAMKWKNLNENDSYYDDFSDIENVFSVCYSNHSSYDEIKILIQYLQPTTVKLNVLPNQICQRNEMYRILDDIIKEYKVKPHNDDEICSEKLNVKYNFSKMTSFAHKPSMSIAKDDISQLKIRRRRKV